jgi:putative transposase
MADPNETGSRAAKIADVLRPLGRGPLSKEQAVLAADLLGVHWTTVYSLRRRFLADPVARAPLPRSAEALRRVAVGWERLSITGSTK